MMTAVETTDARSAEVCDTCVTLRAETREIHNVSGHDDKRRTSLCTVWLKEVTSVTAETLLLRRWRLLCYFWRASADAPVLS